MTQNLFRFGICPNVLVTNLGLPPCRAHLQHFQVPCARIFSPSSPPPSTQLLLVVFPFTKSCCRFYEGEAYLIFVVLGTPPNRPVKSMPKIAQICDLQQNSFGVLGVLVDLLGVLVQYIWCFGWCRCRCLDLQMFSQPGWQDFIICGALLKTYISTRGVFHHEAVYEAIIIFYSKKLTSLLSTRMTNL